MSKIKLSDSIEDVIYKISQGNPGALSVVMQLLQKDPQFGLIQILKLDDMGIRGPRVWMLFNDVFNHRIDALYSALKANRIEKVIRRKKMMDIQFAKEWEYYRRRSEIH